MAVVNWSSLANGGSYTFSLYDLALNPGGTILHFNEPSGITPYQLEFLANADLKVVTVIDLITFKTVTLRLDPLTVTPTNVTFAGGGVVLVGDGTYGTAADHDGHTLVGGSGHDQLFGLGGNDSLVGGGGFDVFTDGYGRNTLSGGDGNDFFYVYSEIGSSNRVSGGPGQDFYYLDYESPALLGPPGTPGHDYVVTDFAPGSDGDIIYTSDLVYIAIGYIDQDPFEARFLRLIQDGNNVLYQGDRDGAAGTTYTWMNLITLQNVSLGSLTFADNFPDLVIGTDSSDLLTGTERNDLMPALLGNDTLSGLAGKDFLAGAAGNDVLDGGTGADTMRGGSGNDLYYVDDAGDVVVEDSNSPGALLLPGDPTGPGLVGVSDITDTVLAAIDYTLANFVENLTLTGSAARGTGNSLANRLIGNAGVDNLIGNAGNDTLDGKAGADKINGGGGNDTIVWGTGDTVNGGAGTDTLKLTINLDLVALANNKIVNIETINMTAGGIDTLTLGPDDVLALSTITDTVKILGDLGDIVNIDVPSLGTPTMQNGLERYQFGTAILLIDPDINVV